MLVTAPACTSATSSSISVQPHPSTASSLTTGSPPTVELRCADATGTYAAEEQSSVVLGVVGLPASPQYWALQTTSSGSADPTAKLFAKTGLTIKVGATFTITVPPEYADVARIGWGNPAVPTTSLSVSACPIHTVPELLGSTTPAATTSPAPCAYPSRSTVAVRSVKCRSGSARPARDKGPFPQPDAAGGAPLWRIAGQSAIAGRSSIVNRSSGYEPRVCHGKHVRPDCLRHPCLTACRTVPSWLKAVIVADPADTGATNTRTWVVPIGLKVTATPFGRAESCN